MRLRRGRRYRWACSAACKGGAPTCLVQRCIVTGRESVRSVRGRVGECVEVYQKCPAGWGLLDRMLGVSEEGVGVVGLEAED